MTPEKAYEWLREQSVKTAHICAVAQLAAWDQRTFIPSLGHDSRSKQLEALTDIIHSRQTESRIAECLDIVENSNFINESDSEVRVNVKAWKREYSKNVKIPIGLACELTRAQSLGESAWESARPANDWKGFSVFLKRIIELNKEKAEALGYKVEPYDALIDDFEPGALTSQIEAIFSDLKTPLLNLYKKIEQKGFNKVTNHKGSFLDGTYSVSSQKQFCELILKKIGFDFEKGRLDETAHPFTCGIGPGDVRITTRYNEQDLTQGFFSCLHEGGHALYDQGLPSLHFGTPRGSFISLGVHESQSRMIENLVGRSLSFWKFALPLAKDFFPSLKNVSLEDFVRAVNKVEPGFIRVDADEITYNIHVLIRLELELAIFRGALTVDDLPSAWNEKMKQYLDIVPPDYSLGVMQDVHWSAGMFGYFPTYTLGNIYAAQIFEKINKDIPGLHADFEKGCFSPFKKWLNEKIHSKGQSLGAKELILNLTSKQPDSKSFIKYCNEKYGQIYEL